jgi:hypothetical protein
VLISGVQAYWNRNMMFPIYLVLLGNFILSKGLLLDYVPEVSLSAPIFSGKYSQDETDLMDSLIGKII